jgi:23S rRNA (guanosine2251-2'-O)-methyltransferase
MSQSSLVFGFHAVEAILKKTPEKIIRLAISSQRQDKKIDVLLKLAKSHSIKTELLSRVALETLVGSSAHQGVAVVCRPPKKQTEQDLFLLLENLSVPAFLLILDGVQDPHNLGACLRTADAAGVHAVLAPKDKSAGLTSAVCKAASGAAETVPFVQVTNLARVLHSLKERNIWLFGAAGEAKKSVYQADLTGPLAILLGAEGTGLRHLTREQCDDLLCVPMRGTVSSLNVSVAAGVFLFEAARQREV